LSREQRLNQDGSGYASKTAQQACYKVRPRRQTLPPRCRTCLRVSHETSIPDAKAESAPTGFTGPKLHQIAAPLRQTLTIALVVQPGALFT